MVNNHPSNIVDFLNGTCTDSSNRYLQDIWKMDDQEIENTHNFIQWIFPLKERSQAVPNSPILTEDEIIHIKDSNITQNNIKKSSEWFLNFLTRNNYWICYSDHNHLRITRAVKSLRMIHSNEEAEKFKKHIFDLIEDNEYKISERALQFWKCS